MHLKAVFGLFCLITVCSVSAQLKTNVASVKADIVSRHNTYRSSVSPTAADMKKMEWSDAAAQMAQTWANRCDYEHSPDNHRPGCGENLAASAGTAGSWAGEAIDPWADERHDYTFGQTSSSTGWWDPKPVGHWTAMIWGNTHQVGCGYKLCPANTSPFGGSSSWHYYVCNYCPAGNIHDGNGLQKPYRSGASCSACPAGWTSCDYKLCSKSTAAATTSRPVVTPATQCPVECQCPTTSVSDCDNAQPDQWSNCGEMEALYGICSAEVEGLEGAGEECQTTCLCHARKRALLGMRSALDKKHRRSFPKRFP